MLGFGSIGEFAIGEVGSATLALASDILQQVVTHLVDEEKLLPTLPTQLHHFTSLETASRIISTDNIRLSHAEYSNDQTEMEEAKDVIRSELSNRFSHVFFSKYFPITKHWRPILMPTFFLRVPVIQVRHNRRTYSASGVLMAKMAEVPA
jgi:hypothetical protein